ncbi:MAG: ABC transporter permease [Bacillota bacterium]
MNTFVQLVIANIKEMARDRMALFWFLAFPVLFILLFGTVFSEDNDTASFSIGLVLEEPDPLGEALAQALGSIPSFNIVSGTHQDELHALEQGDRSLVIVLPAGLSRLLVEGGKAEIPIYYDATRQSSHVLLPVIGRVLDDAERRVTNTPRLFEPRPEAVQSVHLRQIDYLLPGILAMALMQLGLFGSLRLISLREQKILKRLGATPLPRGLLLGSEVTVRLVMALVQTTTIVVIGYLVFRVTVLGSWFGVVGLVLLGAATFVSLGYMLVSFAKSEESAHGIIQLVQFPMMFLSGIFFPVNMMPGFLRPVMKAMPLTYLADALRQVMTGAPPQYSLATDVTVLGAWLVVTFALGIRFFQWE